MKPKTKVVELSIKPKCDYNLNFGSYRPYFKINNNIKLSLYLRFDRYPRTHFINLANYNNLDYFFLPILLNDISTLDKKQINDILLFIHKILNNKNIEEKYKYIDNILINNNFKNYNSIFWIYVVLNDYNSYIINFIVDKNEKNKFKKYFLIQDNIQYLEIKKYFESINPNREAHLKTM